MSVDLLLVVVRLAIGAWLFWSVRTVGTAGPDRARGARWEAVDLAAVSVVIPARDEARSLPTLLASLPPGPEVVVVDDGSADDTAGVAARAGARVVHAGPLPDGWVGKTWACARGADTSTGALLAFVDADVRFGPGGLEAALTTAPHHGLLSVQPFHHPGRAVEKLASIFNVVAFAATDAASPLGRWRGVRGAFGPVLVTARQDLDAVGGHAAIRGDLVDDVALADRYRRSGRPVVVLAGGRAVRFRMYPEGLGQLVEGFTKNLAAGAGSVRRSTALLTAAWVSLLVQAAAAPVLALATGGGARAAAALYAAVAAQYWWMARRVGRFGPLLALAFPVSVALFLVVFARSCWATATGSVSWRGRRLPMRRRDGPR